jgi:hypothetical protein
VALGTPIYRGAAGAATTASLPAFTPAANTVLVVWVASTKATGGAEPAVPVMGGSGDALTWTTVRDTPYDDGVNYLRLTMLWTQIDATPVSQVISATVSNSLHMALTCLEVSGSDLTTSHNREATSAVGDPSTTFGTPPAAPNGCITSAVGFGLANFAPSAGYTELYDDEPEGPTINLHLAVAYDFTAPGATISWTSTNTTSIAHILDLTPSSATFGGGVLAATVNLGGVGARGGLGPPALATPNVGGLVDTIQTTGFLPPASSALVAIVGARAAATFTAPAVLDSSGLAWIPFLTRFYDNATGIVWRGAAFYALVGPSPVSMTVTASAMGAGQIDLAVFNLVGVDTDFDNADTNAQATGDPSITLPSAPIAGSGVLACAFFAGTATATAIPATHTALFETTVGTNLHAAASYDMSPAQIFTWASANNESIAFAFELKPDGSTTAGGGVLSATVTMGGVGVNAAGVTFIPDLVAIVNLGGRGGRFFIPVPTAAPITDRGGVERAVYEMYFDMAPGSRWVVTDDVRAVNISRGLNTWPGDVEAGTVDIVLDDTSGVYSPLNTVVHGGNFRPNLPFDIVATWADHDTSIVSSYFLFRGLVDTITIDPAITARTVQIQGRDRWKILQNREVSTSMMVEFNVSTVLAIAFNAASVDTTQRSVDAISDILPFAWFRSRTLATLMQEMIAGAGYAAYVSANGTVRVRDRYFDINGLAVASWDRFAALNWTIDDSNLINHMTAEAEPRMHITSLQPIASIAGTMVTIQASSSLAFFLSYQDPRNQQAAPARNVTAPVSSTDYIFNANSAGSGAFLMSTASVRLTAFGDAAKIDIFNGIGQTAFITKFQVRGEPIVAQPKVTIDDSDAASQLLYGVRDATLTTRLFTLPSQLDRRAFDVLEYNSMPNPSVRISQIDDYPNPFLVDLADVVTITNSHTGLLDEQFTVFQIEHEIRSDDVGIVHQMTLGLRLARSFSAFILDTDQFDIDRLGR